MQLPPELDFLNPFFIDTSIALRQADWLLSSFDDNYWEYNFGFKKPKDAPINLLRGGRKS